MTRAGDLYSFVAAFVDALARCGLQHVSICPGSRSTPLAVLFHQHPAIKAWMHLDERSAAYFALGQAKATRQPVAVLGTSGTAALNFAPAVAEAFHARVSLLVLTADRPPELQDVGAPQTIDQSQLYGRHVKRCIEMPLPEGGPHAVQYVRTTASRAMADCRAECPGPVHLNFPFREPLIPKAQDGEPSARHAAPFVSVSQAPQALHPTTAAHLAAELRRAQRGLIVCGPQDDPGFPEAVVRLAQTLQFPLLADVLSQVRRGIHDTSSLIDSYDAFLRDPQLGCHLAPDLVLRFGATPVSKPLQQYLQSLTACRQMLVSPADDWHDPALVATDRVQVPPRTFCEALLPPLLNTPRRATSAASAWRHEWERLNARARAVLKACLNETAGLSEPRVFSELDAVLPPGATLFAGNSMPVRDLDTFFTAAARPARFLANRGASGIDGVVSTALGVSSVSSSPCVLVIGDLSFYHDMNGLLAARQHGLQATIVLLHNDGGGIFSFLPQAEAVTPFEELFGTPHGLDFRHTGRLYDLDYCEPEDSRGLRVALEKSFRHPGVSLIAVHTDRAANVRLHRDLWQAVSRQIRCPAPPEPSSCASP
jgi:2-succinyl-5-enolpyruvyl-6-hydroxy-3-cyclohexene-1-carboxylate synthase